MISVFPDTWNKMRVTYAKAVFTQRTLSDEFAFLSKLTNCTKEISNAVVTDQELDLCMCLQTKRADILVKNQGNLEIYRLSVKSAISCLQFRVYSAALYNEFFLNKNIKFKRSNIVRIEKRIKYILDWFTEWFNSRDIRKKNHNEGISKIWEKSVMSIVTFQVMHLGSFGFLGYCKYVLDNCSDVKFVPIIH